MVKVSVITVTYNLIENNRKKYFRQCLESVHNQDYQNIEHLIIDGGSTDGTVNLIKEFADKGWIKYISEPDKGIYDAMNKGVKLASGKYLAFLNSDDYWFDKSGISRSIEKLEKNNADFSYAPVVYVDEIKKTETIGYPKVNNIFFSHTPFSHQTMFIKKNVMDKEGMYDISYKIIGDLDFILRMYLKGYKGVYVRKIFTKFRLDGMSCVFKDSAEAEAIRMLYKHFNSIYPITTKQCIMIRRKKSFPIKILYNLYKKTRIVNFLFLWSITPIKVFKFSLRNIVDFGFSRSGVRLSVFIFDFNINFERAKDFFDFVRNSKLRQPARKIYYFLTFRKLNNKSIIKKYGKNVK